MSGGLFYGFEKVVVTQRLCLAEGQPDVSDGLIGQNLPKLKKVLQGKSQGFLSIALYLSLMSGLRRSRRLAGYFTVAAASV